MLKTVYPCFALVALCTILTACRDQPPAERVAEKTVAPADSLRHRLHAYVQSKQADIGVAIIGLDDGDTVTVNGARFYPLMSVAKFPQALLLLHLVDEGKMSKTLRFGPQDLKQRTASTIRKDHPGNTFELTIPEVLGYSIGQSDNITSNKMFEAEGGPSAVTKYVQELGIGDVRIVTDYAHMGKDSAHRNEATPLAMARLLEKFHRGGLLSDSSQAMLWKALVEAGSGPDRLKGMLPGGAVVGHKTGTGGRDEATGVTEAFNDIGIVQLPDGRHFAIAVFLKDSKESPEQNARIIAEICKQSWDYFTSKAK